MNRTPLLLEDGTILSVQASSSHYCSPKSDNPDKGYGSVEIMIYKDAEGYNNNTSEGWVTPSRVLELIAEHGGVIGGQLPPLNFGLISTIKERMLKLAIEGEKLRGEEE